MFPETPMIVLAFSTSLRIDQCQAATQAQSAKMEGSLHGWPLWGLWIHQRLCRLCRRYARQLESVHLHVTTNQEQLQETFPEVPTSDFNNRLMSQLKEPPEDPDHGDRGQ